MAEDEKLNLKTKAYNILKDKLKYCIYAPGSLLNEVQLANDLGISRTPVREAISLLETEGYLKILPKKGIYVTDILLNDVLQIFQVRMEIEPVVVRLAGPNLPVKELIAWREKFKNEPLDQINGFGKDTEMHLFFVEYCNNVYISDMMRKVFDKNLRIIIASQQNHSHLQEACDEHIAILTALIDQKYDQAAELMHTHITSCRRATVDFFYLNNRL
jgi:DNA-binding GntR family transcriptional regulator